MVFLNDSFALKDKNERTRREAMLVEPHMQQLVSYLNDVRKELGTDYEMPMFDPCDGGISARVLILLEAPGPKAVGSQFISRNNPDKTANNINNLLKVAEIPRKDTILWNIVPWYIGDVKKIRPATQSDINLALPYLGKLINLLPDLDFIVLMGKPAQAAKLEIQKIIKQDKNTKVIFCTAHPSPKVANIYPEKMLEAQQVFKVISAHLKALVRNSFEVTLGVEDIDDLLVYLPIFNSPEFKAYSLLADTNNYRRVKYDEAVTAFYKVASQRCWYSEYDPIIVDDILRNETLLKNATIGEIKAMLTYFVCNERWIDGFQAQLIKDGHISRLLECLKVLKPELI